MKNKNYLILCGVLTVLTIVSILSIPGFSDTIETGLLVFLMINASG
ncbi:MAG: hypothetical protein VX206_06570 [Pseudomonadota bacterium]|jgi:hypothetical protein|nr:hypothetical protein [Pseudomonadales bacterium]MEE3290379.1 hypothetical protein [Pseudomonadota bacterium]|tara:strand:- start:274 stop:411 length:138 start_codon:yes stop_codon:yes gene_type:complete